MLSRRLKISGLSRRERRSVAFIIFCALIFACCVLADSRAAQATTTSDCAAALAKDKLTQGSNTFQQLAYLSTIDQSNFQQYQHDNNVSGRVSYGLFSLGADASWSDFQESLNAYKSSVGYNSTYAESASVSVESNTPAEIQAYVDCLKLVGNGVYVVPVTKAASAIILQLSYNNPGAATSASVHLDLTGGKFKSGATTETVSVPQGSTGPTITILRTEGASDLLVTANTSGASILGGYTSVPWSSPALKPSPLANTKLVMQALPRGTILLWSGSPASIPAGWHICDGTAGTIDLTNRFPLGVVTGGPIGTQGGSTQYTVTVSGTTGPPNGAHNSINQHDHQDAVAMGTDHTHPFTGSGPLSIMPPYTSVYFIQKVT